MYLSDEDKAKIIEICKRNDVSYCAVFGSYSRGEADETSDVDLLVKFSKRIGLFDFVGIGQDLEDALHHKVDLVTEDGLSKYIREGVMKDLKVIYEERKLSPVKTYS